MFKYVVAAILGLLASLGGLTAAQAGSQLSVSCAPPTVTFNSVTLNCRTSRPTPLMYTFGGGRFSAGSGTNHPLTVKPLPSDMSFRYAAMVRVNGALRSLHKEPFRTADSAVVSSEVSGRDIRLGGSPTFLLFENSDGCIVQPDRMQIWRKMGDSTLAGAGWTCDYQNPQHAAQLIHEACMNLCRWLEKDSQKSQGVDPPEKLGFDGNQNSGSLTYYLALFFCGSQASNNAKQYHLMRQTVEQSNKPVVATNPLVRGNAPPSDLCVTPARLTANLWTEACVVKGIGYQSLGYDHGNLVTVSTEIQDAAGRFKSRFAARQPAMLGPSVRVRSKSPKLVACAHRYSGVTTVVTVNLSGKPLKTSVKVAGAGNRMAWRYSEGSVEKVAKVKASRSSFSGVWPANSVRLFEYP